MIFLKVFFSGWLQVFLIALSTVFISTGNYLAEFCVSVVVGYVWGYNVTQVGKKSFTVLTAYSLGGAVGSVCGMFLGDFILPFI